MMSTVHDTSDGIMQFTKGAPDEILKKCSYALANGEAVPMDDEVETCQFLGENKKIGG